MAVASENSIRGINKRCMAGEDHMPARRGRIGGCGALPRGRSAYAQSRTRAGEPTRSSPHGAAPRSDLLTGSGSRLDIHNINLLATLLVHDQAYGTTST
jgi:hypothetical protein